MIGFGPMEEDDSRKMVSCARRVRVCGGETWREGEREREEEREEREISHRVARGPIFATAATWTWTGCEGSLQVRLDLSIQFCPSA